MNRIKNILQIFIWILAVNISLPGQNEAYFVDIISRKLGGVTEMPVYGGRVDIVTDEYAIEVEWARKWKNAIGQALWYGLQTNKKPGIVLIMRSKNDYRYGIMLQSALDYAGLHDKIKVWFYPEDFGGSMNSIRYGLYQSQDAGNTASSYISKENNNNAKTNYWLSRNSKVRHNSSCRWYMRSKGRFCGPDEGRPCKLCGG